MTKGEQTVEGRDPAPAPHGDSARGDSALDEQLLEADLLVEDVSIDGMCGVY